MYPEYVKLGNTCLRLRGLVYYRDAGAWSVNFKAMGGKLYVVEPRNSKMAHANRMELTPTTREEWLKDNKGHV